MKYAALLQILIVLTIPVVTAASLQGPDVTAPTIDTIDLVHGPNTIITWETNEPATSRVDYGTTQGMTLNTSSGDYETTHSIELATTEDETYYYQITSCDEYGNCASTDVESFTAGGFGVTAEVPAFATARSIDIPGTTRPGAEVEIIVNDASVRKAIIDDGEFLFRNIKLVKGTNTVVVKAALGEDTAQQSHTVRIDNEPPRVNVTVESAVTTPETPATITVSEDINLSITLADPEGEPPLIPRNLREDGVSDEHARLAWDRVEDANQYAVYRNGKRVAVSQTTDFFDDKVASGTNYSYQVTSVNDACIESSLSDSVYIMTEEGNAQEEPYEPAYFECEIPPKTQQLTKGEHTIPLTLRPGQNVAVFKATDPAGYTTVIEERILYDTGPPEILEHNLDSLSPTYERTVTVRGKLSEQGSVTIFVNDKPQKTEPTDEDGKFAIDITLARDPQVRSDSITGGQTVNTELGWTSRVKIEAVDAVGLTATSEEVPIEYQLCGFGKWITFEQTTPMPEILSPKLFREGLAQTGIAFNYEYNGGYDATINHGGIRISPMQLSPEVADEYDNNLVTPYLQTQPGRGDTPGGKGYIQLNFKPINDPWTELSGGDKDKPDDATEKDYEQRISEHRRDDCLIPGFGCVRLLFEVEIPFTEKVSAVGYDPNQAQADQTQQHIQKECLRMEIAIDQSFRTTDYVPNEWLQGISDFLGRIIDTINTILKPIETIGKYLFYSCTVATFVSIVPNFLEKYNCEYNKFASMVTGEGAFNELIAEVDACDAEYGEDTEEASNCNACASAKKQKRALESTYRQLCDRVGCPDAPSLQYYLKTKGRESLQQVPASAHTIEQLDQYALDDGKLYVGNDCAAWMKNEQIKEQNEQDRQMPPSLFFTPQQIDSIYKDWLEHKDDEKGDTPSSDVICDGMHPATPECCGYAYVDEWGSACGISAFGGLDTFDEIKESVCLSAQKVNRNKIPGPDGTTQTCNTNLFNAAGGFCDPKGQPTPDAFRVVLFEGAKGQASKLHELGLAGTREQYMYLLVIPKQEIIQGTQYDLQLGYIVENVEFQQRNQSRDILAEQRYYISSNMEAIELDAGRDMKAEYFNQDRINQYHENQLPGDFYQSFARYLCNRAGYGDTNNCAGLNQQGARELYERTMAKIGTPDQEYIIRPRDSLFNSIRCLCFPALIAYLKQWRNIMQVVQQCINTIVLTGDGEAGACQSIISQQVCDLIHEALACFTQKFTSGSGRVDATSNIFAALTSAGSDMQRGVQSRYGQESSLYQSVFVDQKLTHSICMFAFTGTWNFDLDVAYDQTVDDFPIDSQGALLSASRRFLSFNPTTSPPGLVDWIYEFDIMFAAGADVDLNLKLQCSGGFNCRESQGFENNKCDCEAPRSIDIYPADLPQKLDRGEVISPNILHVLKGSPGNGQIRYDKAILEYSWQDDKGHTRRCTVDGREGTPQCPTATIGLAGGPASVPAFCKFFTIPPSFRCQFAEAAGGIRFLGTEAVYPHKIEVSR